VGGASNTAHPSPHSSALISTFQHNRRQWTHTRSEHSSPPPDNPQQLSPRNPTQANRHPFPPHPTTDTLVHRIGAPSTPPHHRCETTNLPQTPPQKDPSQATPLPQSNSSPHSTPQHINHQTAASILQPCSSNSEQRTVKNLTSTTLAATIRTTSALAHNPNTTGGLKVVDNGDTRAWLFLHLDPPPPPP